MGFAWYVAHSPSYELLYGALAAFPIFLLWIFVFWMIVLAGAAVTASLANAESRMTRPSVLAEFVPARYIAVRSTPWE